MHAVLKQSSGPRFGLPVPQLRLPRVQGPRVQGGREQ